jgi:hypothetical protein
MRNYNKIPIPEPIKLPQKSDLGILDLRYSMNKNVNLWLSSSTKLTLDKGIISPPIPTEFISGNCRGWARDKTICDRIEKKDKDKGKEKDKEPVVSDTRINIDGIQSRIIALPVIPGNYVNLQPVSDRIYYNRFVSGSRSGSAYMFDLKTKGVQG